MSGFTITNTHIAQCSDFALIAMPKVGSHSLYAWIESNSRYMDNNAGHLKDIRNIITNKDVYSTWRPSYERMLTGLNEGLTGSAQYYAGSDDYNLSNVIHSKAYVGPSGQWTNSFTSSMYYKAVDDFAKSVNFSINPHVKAHTNYIWQYGLYTNVNLNKINWVNIHNMGSFHTYVNKKYNFIRRRELGSFPTMCHDEGISKEVNGPLTSFPTMYSSANNFDRINRPTPAMLEEYLKESHPNVIDALKSRAERDYLPEKFLDLQ